MNITIQDLERDAAGFFSRVEAGETLIVTRDGHPIAEIRPSTRTSSGPAPPRARAGSPKRSTKPWWTASSENSTAIEANRAPLSAPRT